MSYYGSAIEKKTPLSAQEERALFRAYRKKKTALRRTQLVEQYLYWAAEIACRYCGPRFSKEEAISAANLGLMHAIESFNPRKGARFVTWSFLPIRRAIVDAMRTNSYLINPNPALRALSYQCQKAGKTGEAVETLNRGRREVFANVEKMVPEIPDEKYEERDSVERHGLLDFLKDRLPELLTKQEQKIIELRYFGKEQCIFRLIGKKMGLKKDRVKYLHDKAVEKLQHHLKKEA